MVVTSAVEERTERLVALRADVPPELRLRIKVQAVQWGVTMRDYITEVLERGLEAEEKLTRK